MDVGSVFPTRNCGDVEVVRYDGCFSVLVRFLNTGNEYVTASDQIRKGTVKDRFLPNLCGVGYLGSRVPYVASIYDCWVNMIKRCYDEPTQDMHPTYKGCSVCDEWLCFKNFHSWYVANYIDGFEVDKDKIVKDNKIYSPDTCLFISQEENKQMASQKKYSVTRKDGTKEIVKNMSKFCRDNSLTLSGMRRVLSGERKTHKDFIKVELIK